MYLYFGDDDITRAAAYLCGIMTQADIPFERVDSTQSPSNTLLKNSYDTLDAERRNSKLSVRLALEKAGVKSFFLGKTEKQLIHLGRYRGAKLSDWLLQLDLDLKGDSRSDPRLLLEMFITNLAIAKERTGR